MRCTPRWLRPIRLCFFCGFFGIRGFHHYPPRWPLNLSFQPALPTKCHGSLSIEALRVRPKERSSPIGTKWWCPLKKRGARKLLMRLGTKTAVSDETMINKTETCEQNITNWRNKLEEPGGRVDRLSPQGILNHIGFNTPPLTRQSHCPLSGRNFLSKNMVVVVAEVLVDSSWSSLLQAKIHSIDLRLSP